VQLHIVLLTVRHSFSYQNRNRIFILYKVTVTHLVLLLIVKLSGYT